MKKVKNLVAILLVAILLISMIPVSVNAETMSDLVTTVDSGDTKGNLGSMTTTVVTIIKYIRGIAVVAAIIAILVIGIKLIIGSSEEKAKYKEMLLPLVVGVIVVIFATTIIEFLFGLNSGSASDASTSANLAPYITEYKA